MLRWTTSQLMAIAVGTALLIAAPVTRGDIVSFTTTGSFYDPSNVNLGSSHTFTAQVNGSPTNTAYFTLTFSGNAVTNHNTFVDPPTVSLGTFTLAVTTTPPTTTGFGAFGGDSFGLIVNQTTPAGSASPVSSLFGIANIAPPTFNSGSVTFNFPSTQNPFTINGENYKIANGGSLTLNAVPNGAGSGPVALNATLVSAPVPATASMGLTFFAAIGLAYGANTWWQRRRAIAA